jgi:hypothetical protein
VTTVAPAGFTLRVPASWYEFDVWRATHTSDLARLVDARIAEAPELVPRRGALLKLLREAAAEAERQGAVFCAAMVDRLGDAGMLLATVMVFHTAPSPDPTDDSVEVMAGQVSSVAAVEGSSTWRRVEIVETPAGRALRLSGVETADLEERDPVPCVVMQTLLPVPDGQGVLNVVLTSPQVELADSMLELFEAISETLAWPTASVD